MNIADIEVKLSYEKTWRTEFVLNFCKFMVFLKFWSDDKVAEYLIKRLKIKVEDVNHASN
ncbi:hypothetical protein [Acinetobacter phage vB_ApiM_IME-Ap7]|uniref:Uncharacterized protein n=1 Tax=Thermovibrio guaymasensis TaxID=240167 RepID=A0A420W5B9_9BACT|nr:hypothetical protein C7457_1658 [Thermovibrio guaymasensis]